MAILCLDVSAQMTTSSLRGTVTDSNKKPLAGAAVLLRQSKTGVEYYSIVNNDGRFSIHGIKPDDGYVLDVEFIGYEPFKLVDMVLRLGESHREDIVLKESAVALGDVVVTASQVQSVGVTENFDKRQIQQLPTVSRSLYDVVRLMPQASSVRGGGMSFGGVSNRYNSFMVNGVANNDMYGLSSSGTHGGLSNANPVSLDAIEQIEVSVASYDVRRSGFGGGVINAITKSGTNKFEGSAYTYYNNQNLYGSTPGKDVENREKLENYNARIYGATFGGPIVKDKLFFFVSGEYNLHTSPSSYYLDADGAMLIKEELDRVAARYKALTGYDGGGYYRRDVERRSMSLLANVDWHINKQNRLSASYSYLDAEAEEYANSYSSFTFVGSGYANYSSAHHLSLSLESRLSDYLHNTLKVGLSRVGDGREADIEGAMPSVIIKNAGSTKGVTLNIGNNRYAGVNSLTQNVVTLTDNLIWDGGAHSIVVGMHHELYNIHNRYLANSLGTYTYNSIEDFERDMAAQYEYNYTDPAVTGTTTWGPRFRAAEFSLYAQDNWDMGAGFNLTYGLRATLPAIFNTPTSNEEFNRGDIAMRYGVRIGDVPQTQLLLSPRVGLTWRRNYEAGVLSLEGGVGIFTGQVPFVWVVNNYSNTGVEQKGLKLTAKMDGGEVVKTAAPFTAEPSPTTMSNTSFMLNAMDKGFKYPQNFKANLVAEFRERNGWVMRAEALYTKVINGAVFRNLAVEPTAKGVYAVAAGDGTQTSGLMPQMQRITLDYSAVYYMENTSRGYSYSLSGSIAKEFDMGLSVMASYIFGHSYSVCDVPSTSSSSNWSRTYALDLNDPELSYSSYDVPHKLSFSATYHKRYAPLFDVTAGVVYQLTSGQRYSLTFGESVDFNGDGVYGSTLMYIPTEDELSRMRFADGDSRRKWNDYIKANDYLSEHRGEFAARNAMQAPVESRIDLHLAHGFYFSRESSRRLELTLDVMNFGNLLCRHWGSYYNVGNVRLQPVTVVSQQDGELVYRFTNGDLTPNDLMSRWSMQLGVRVRF
ncbi:MAG: TonB-dependent receptor [Alistipes sp.]|nr:TonB-dependent receptor [Alistipes sp.]